MLLEAAELVYNRICSSVDRHHATASKFSGCGHTNNHSQATQTTSLDLKEQWVVNIVNFIRHHLKDVKKGWFNLEEVCRLCGSERHDQMSVPPPALPDIVGVSSVAFVYNGRASDFWEGTPWSDKRGAHERGSIG